MNLRTSYKVHIQLKMEFEFFTVSSIMYLIFIILWACNRWYYVVTYIGVLSKNVITMYYNALNVIGFFPRYCLRRSKITNSDWLSWSIDLILLRTQSDMHHTAHRVHKTVSVQITDSLTFLCRCPFTHVKNDRTKCVNIFVAYSPL